MNKKTVLVVVVFVVAFAAVLVLSTVGLRQHTVEVCITYNGRTECRTASGETRDEALRTATDNACAFLASGMADSLACGRTPPAKVTWK